MLCIPDLPCENIRIEALQQCRRSPVCYFRGPATSIYRNYSQMAVMSRRREEFCMVNLSKRIKVTNGILVTGNIKY